MKIVDRKTIIAVLSLELGFGAIINLRSEDVINNSAENIGNVNEIPEIKEAPASSAEESKEPVKDTVEIDNTSQQSSTASNSDNLGVSAQGLDNSLNQNLPATPELSGKLSSDITIESKPSMPSDANAIPQSMTEPINSPQTDTNSAPISIAQDSKIGEINPKPEENIENKAENKDEDDEEEAALTEEQRGFRGNWEKKKKWLIKARNRNNKIQALVSEFEKMWGPFQNTFFELSKEIDLFWKNVGFNEEKFDIFFKKFEDYFEQLKQEKLGSLASKEEEGQALSNEEMELKDKVQTEIDEFSKYYLTFKDDIKLIPSLKLGIEDRLKRLNELIKNAMEAAEEGRKKYEEIWEVIDDQKAEALYIDVKNSWNKVKSIYDYIKEEFNINFNSSVEIINSHLKKAAELIGTLEEKGLIIKNRSERIEKIKKEEAERLALERQRRASNKKEVIKNVRWYKKTYNITKDFIIGLYDEILKLFGFGKKNLAAKPVSRKSSGDLKNLPINN